MRWSTRWSAAAIVRSWRSGARHLGAAQLCLGVTQLVIELRQYGLARSAPSLQFHGLWWRRALDEVAHRLERRNSALGLGF
jgi:hypothetical protein